MNEVRPPHGRSDSRAASGKAQPLSEQEFALFVASVRDYAMLMLDPTGNVVSWNAGAEHIKGYRAEEILGRHFSVFYPPEDVQHGIPERHLEEAAKAGHLQYKGWRLRKNGTRFWADVVITALFEEDGGLRGFAKVTRDVTERRTAEEELVRRSLYDALTGLPNRTLLLDRIRQAVGRLERHRGKVAVLLVDLDRFKDINDTLGHDAGDRILITVADRLVEILDPEDTVARLSADEFAVVCQVPDHGEDVIAIAERAAAAVARPVVFERDPVTVSASIGIAETDSAEAPAELLLRDADTAMYHAKRGGEGPRRVLVFHPEMREELDRRRSLERSLQRAVDRGELSLVYQPVVRLFDGQVACFEALLRWQPSHGEAISPAEFIPVAEDSGLIRPIGAWVLEQACMQAVRWQSASRSGSAPGVSVNVSARQLVHRGLVGHLDRILAATGVPPSSVSLELTESQLISDVGASVSVLSDLKRLGVSLSIDDFGTGYSSLNYLKQLPVDTLKIDRSFVAGLGADAAGRQDSILVAATIKMAQALGLSVIAEGVETSRQHAELLDLGCDYGQGWLFGRPQPPARINLTDYLPVT